DPQTVAKTARDPIQAPPIFPLGNPGILSIPLGFLGAFFGTPGSRVESVEEHKFIELDVRANAGLGTEKATSH
ncbi:MAG TPA: cation acetate symporter, partial [Bryobacteraceae bacterium]|nr:cation acetate symporter [Bryobacteraceae bacterium]